MEDIKLKENLLLKDNAQLARIIKVLEIVERETAVQIKRLCESILDLLATDEYSVSCGCPICVGLGPDT